MPGILASILGFIVALGILVTIHEFGHFWVARRLGVRVLRFAVGFGRRLIGWTSPVTGTEYRLAAIPLGGYVKMLDEREGPVAEQDKSHAFNRVHPWRRIAIVAAGPLINFLFAIAAYWLVMMLGVPGIKPIVGAPTPDTPAAEAGLSAQDRVLSLDGKKVASWQDLRFGLMDKALNGDTVKLTVLGKDDHTRTLSLDMGHLPSDPEAMFRALGMHVYQPKAAPVLGQIMDDSPAAQAGLQSGDRVLSVNDKTVNSPQELVEVIQSHPGETVGLQIRRNGGERRVKARLARKTGQSSEAVGRLGAAVGADPKALKAMRMTQRLGPVAALPAAVNKTWQLSEMSVRLMGRMVTGQVSWQNVGGPVQIASYAGQSAQMGLVAFISFLAFISINLGLINLLPIPVLDGGHILYYAIEWIRGRPMSEAVQALGQHIGLGVLLMLMILAFYNDILRLLG